MGRRRRQKREGPTGVFLVDKPVGPTSRTVLDDVARRLDLGHAGHCGTLDPLASGLLVVVSGRATRVQDVLTGHDKTYHAVVRLGATSVTDDAEGPIESFESSTDDADAPLPRPIHADVEAEVSKFVGEIDQKPPALSAIRVDGERLYKAARRGEEVDVPMRRVVIRSIDVIDVEGFDVTLRVHCGSGVYIRSLARDLGERLGIGGYLAGLRRETTGGFHIDRASVPESLSVNDMLSLEEALAGFDRVDVEQERLADLLNGREVEALPVDGNDRSSATNDETEPTYVWVDGRVIGRARRRDDARVRLARLIRDPRTESTEA